MNPVYHVFHWHRFLDCGMKLDLSLLLLRPGRGAEYSDQPVCLCVCLCTGPIRATFCVQIPCGRGSVLLWWGCDRLCTSGFMDDVTFGRNGRDAERWRWHSATVMNDVAIPGGVWCLWMLVWLCFLFSFVLYTHTCCDTWRNVSDCGYTLSSCLSHLVPCTHL